MMAATEPLANWAIRAFGPPEIFALIFLGLSIAATVGAETVWKGWLSVLFGLLLATIGTDPAGGLARFDFNIDYLMAGIHFVPLILGFFAVSEVFIQGHQIARGLRVPPALGIDFPSLAEFCASQVRRRPVHGDSDSSRASCRGSEPFWHRS